MALYPPIVASSMPAFNIDDKQVKIYFSLSPYNTTKISNLATQVTVRRQSSNVSVLLDGLTDEEGNTTSENITTSEIVKKPIEQDDIGYYITISNSNIKGGFIKNVLYKVQIRLLVDTENSNNNLFTNDSQNYSEWSTVCIIKPVVAPTFYIDDFYTLGMLIDLLDLNYFYLDAAEFLAVFKSSLDNYLMLKSWRLRLLDNSYDSEIDTVESKTLADSGVKAVSAYNYTPNSTDLMLECSLPYNFKNNNISQYKLLFEIITLNDYHGEKLYSFNYSPSSSTAPTVTQSNIKINQELGYIKLSFTISDDTDSLKNYVIRRTDSKSNFDIWEDLYNFTYELGQITYYDFTALSGVIYNYCLQSKDIRGRRSKERMLWVNDTQEYNVLVEYNHSFLLESSRYINDTSAGLQGVFKQLKLKYDFQISSYKTNISESKTDTIGGKYPYIRRNGNMYYRSFPCTGTITGYMDNAELFALKDELFDNQTSLFNRLRGIDDELIFKKYDYTYERKFRLQVEEFLYNVKPKLYKSTQEGNILIKIMEVSLTPKNLLGRLIYTFSATAYLIDEPTLDNLNKYGIIDTGTYNTSLGRWKTQEYTFPNLELILYEDEFIQQLSSYSGEDLDHNIYFSNLFKGGLDIIGTETTSAAANSASVLNSFGVSNAIYHQENLTISLDDLNARIVTKLNFKYLRIEVLSEPYLIKSNNGVLTPVNDLELEDIGASEGNTSSIDKRFYLMLSTLLGTDYYLGTLFTINGQQILISPPNNIYEIKLDSFSGIEHLSIVPAKDTALTVNYVVKVWDEQDLSKVPKSIKTNKINGQLLGTFVLDKDVINEIKTLYKQDYLIEEESIKRNLLGVTSIRIEAEPDTWIEIKSKAADSSITPEGENVYINFTGDIEWEVSDVNMYITGVKFKGKRVLKELCTDGYEEGSEVAAKQYDIKNDGTEIFYQNSWCQLVTDMTDAYYYYFVPNRNIPALIYYFATEKERYY